MLAFRELQSLVHQMQRSGLSRLEVNGNGYAIRMTCGPDNRPTLAPEPVAVAVTAPPASVAITAPIPGRLWRQDPLSARDIGPQSGPVEAGCLLALVQAGPLLLPVRAPQDGVLAHIGVEQGQAVEYDQPLMQLQTEEPHHAQHRS